MIEAELKFRINEENLDILKNKILSKGFIVGDTNIQIDTVFLEAKNKDFSTFAPGDPVARVRMSGGAATMTVKKKLTDGASAEHETVCDNYSAAVGIFESLNMNKVVEVNKERTEYKNNSITIAMDKVAGLGWYMEIEEILDESESIPEAEERLLAVATALGLSKDSLETQKYDSLLMAASKAK
jgi:predicted adenylyl cyclase CyaB